MMMMNKQFFSHLLVMTMMLMVMTCDRHGFFVDAASDSNNTDTDTDTDTDTASNSSDDDSTMFDVVAGQDDLSIFAEAIEYTGLTDILLSKDKSWTVFAPIDSAFEAAYAGNITDIDVDELKEVLLNHMVDGTYTTSGINENTTLTTFQGMALTFSATNNANGSIQVTVNGVPMNMGDVDVELPAINGVLVHKIGGILTLVAPTAAPTPTDAPTSVEDVITETPTPLPTPAPTELPTPEPTPEPTPAPYQYNPAPYPMVPYYNPAWGLQAYQNYGGYGRDLSNANVNSSSSTTGVVVAMVVAVMCNLLL